MTLTISIWDFSEAFVLWDSDIEIKWKVWVISLKDALVRAKKELEETFSYEW